ncbi:hypothetical protein OG601_47360 [Streptomyces sp. NBC_01239]|uniref:hypothetical protein n=1 Tax=Streptomyces sp. NBC_01239 TaxID=2903792 RepID=UPI00224DCC63|nr:hypothetical protein [Streptomyces sp. NBC_01239]MCX4816746.1 hypothetical protein [Streptomyces sp. NBC_01239]MCX4818194.1 hypothetical protein [Streptomyces sp. NBC_01239]
MPSLSSLIDNFNDATISPNWGNAYGGVSESAGKAHVPCTIGFAGYQTAYSWTFAGATLYVAVTTVPAASTATTAYASVFVNAPNIADNSDPLYGCRIGFIINTVSSQLRCESDTAYSDGSSVNITYSSTTHKFLRLREDGTNVYWDTSPDGSTWTNRRTLATPAWVTASVETCAVDLGAHRDAGTADEARYDLFNTLADGAVYTGTATGSGLSAATVTGKRTAVGAATGIAQANAGVTGIATFHGSATGAAHSEASAVSAGNEFPGVATLAAGHLDLRIEQGGTFMQTYTVTDDGWTWEGWTARAQIRTAPADNGALLLDLTGYLTVTGPAVRLAIPASVTETLDRNGVWDLEMVNGPAVVRILEGKVRVSLEVTR